MCPNPDQDDQTDSVDEGRIAMAEGMSCQIIRLTNTAHFSCFQTHNALCYKKLAPLIAHDKRATRWLKRECERDFVPDEKVINIEW
jgi:hypothetical protein